jgi:hypothetical protein
MTSPLGASRQTSEVCLSSMISYSPCIVWGSIICGIATFLLAWVVMLTYTELFNIPTEMWFYDSSAAGIISIFFLLYDKEEKE